MKRERGRGGEEKVLQGNKMNKKTRKETNGRNKRATKKNPDQGLIYKKKKKDGERERRVSVIQIDRQRGMVNCEELNKKAEINLACTSR